MTLSTVSSLQSLKSLKKCLRIIRVILSSLYNVLSIFVDRHPSLYVDIHLSPSSSIGIHWGPSSSTGIHLHPFRRRNSSFRPTCTTAAPQRTSPSPTSSVTQQLSPNTPMPTQPTTPTSGTVTQTPTLTWSPRHKPLSPSTQTTPRGILGHSKRLLSVVKKVTLRSSVWFL